MTGPMDASFTIIYDELKGGKTTDLLAAFPRATWVAAPGALAPAESVWGFKPPARYDLETFRQVSELADRLKPSDIALVIDDATLLADRTADYLMTRKGLSGYDLWGTILIQAVRMRDKLRRKGIHIAFSCHPRHAHMEAGVRVKGGPSFQGQCFLKLPSAADFLLRGEARGESKEANGGVGWPRVYRTGYSPDWMQGSRYATPDMSPMNLGEILRLASYAIPRLPGLEWQELVAEKLAGILQGHLDDPEYVQNRLETAKKAILTRNIEEAHAYWALRDGYDRAVLRQLKGTQRKTMYGV